MNSKHIINQKLSVKEVLQKLNELDGNNLLFIVNERDNLIGSISDGDIRRGLLNGLNVSSPITEFSNKEVKCLNYENFKLSELISIKRDKISIIPILKENKIYRILNLKLTKSFLPLDAIIMAGGKGMRLKPLTNTLPKPLIKVGDKAIIDYNVNLLLSYGIEKILISVNYLGEKIEKHFRNKNIKEVECFWEKNALGTIGSAGLVKKYFHDHVLIMNCDILTNIDLESFFLEFLNNNADMAVAAVPYNVYIPYAVMDINESMVQGFTEKPEYKYYTNGGIYIIKKEILRKYVNGKDFYNATDLMEEIIKSGGKIYSYPMNEYWLDIGKLKDLEKANNEIRTIKF